MSHFTVLVVGDDIEEQLAPFQENNMGDCPEEYLEFDDTTSELEASFAKRTPEEQEEYPTLDDWAGAGGMERDPETGLFGYWRNPNAKWDWYVIGGRWNGFFRTKNGECVNQVRKGDLDLEGMFREADEAAQIEADLVRKAIGDQPIPRWKDYLAKREAEGVGIEQIRAEFHALPVIKQLEAVPEVKERLWFDDAGERYCGGDLVEFVRRRRIAAIRTHAVLMDGRWSERGEMGWWAIVKDAKDDWPDQFMALFNSIPDDALLTVVDCHI